MSCSLTIKQVPEELNRALDRAARAQRRSKNSLVIDWLEERARQTARPEAETLRREVRALAEQFRVRISRRQHQQWAREGRE
jgi:predicted HicB family RNase H-like nuclease